MTCFFPSFSSFSHAVLIQIRHFPKIQYKKSQVCVKGKTINRIFFRQEEIVFRYTEADNSGSAAEPRGDAMYHTARCSAERFTNCREGHDMCHTVARPVKVTTAARSATFDRFS